MAKLTASRLARGAADGVALARGAAEGDAAGEDCGAVAVDGAPAQAAASTRTRAMRIVCLVTNGAVVTTRSIRAGARTRSNSVSCRYESRRSAIFQSTRHAAI